MTFREKLAIDHPLAIGDQYKGGCKLCPHDWGYEPIGCPFTLSRLDIPKTNVKKSICIRCWDREMPETENECEFKPFTNKQEIESVLGISKGETKMGVTTRKTKKELLEEIAELEKALERNERYAQYDEAASETKVLMDSYINAGFSREEAFTIVMKMIVGAINTNRR